MNARESKSECFLFMMQHQEFFFMEVTKEKVCGVTLGGRRSNRELHVGCGLDTRVIPAQLNQN
jgi:hypothetical protein